MWLLQIDIVELLQGDVRLLQESEAAGQLSSTQEAHLDHLLGSLLAAKDVIRANVMKTGQGASGWLEQKRWIAKQTVKRDKIRDNITAARDQVVRSAQLLNLSLSVHVVQSMACAAAGDGGESEAEDAQQLLDYMRQHQHDSDAQVESILAQLQRGRADAAHQTERMAAEMQRVCLTNDDVKQSNDELKLQLERMMRQLARLPAAAVVSPMYTLQPLHARLSEFVVGESLSLKADELLGEGSSGRVMKAECMRMMGSGVWVECAFKEMAVKLPAGGGAKGREKRERLQARYNKALRKEAAVMWLLGGQPNILRLYGVCSRPLGLVFEYCNRGTLQQWLWVEVKQKDAKGRKVSRFVSTQQLAEAAASASAGASKQQQQQQAVHDDGGEGYAQLLSDGDIQGHLNLAQRLLIAQELINAVSYLHAKHLAHGDIKSSNVLVHDLGAGMGVQESSSTPPAAAAQPLLCVRLSDFGSAKVQASFTGQLGSTLRGQSAAGGTLRWSAPEQLMDDAEADRGAASTDTVSSSTDSALSSSSSSLQSDVDSAPSSLHPPSTQSSVEDRSADVYSLALLLAELFTSLPPYAHLPDARVHHAIYMRQPPYSDALVDGVSPALRLLVRACSAPLGQRATLAVLKYQLWPQLLAALSGWKEQAVVATPPPLPWRPAAVSAPANSAPPLPARPRLVAPPRLDAPSAERKRETADDETPTGVTRTARRGMRGRLARWLPSTTPT